MAAHTPRPWALDANMTADRVIGGARPSCIATIPHRVGLPDSESRANARLIAAAPELLAGHVTNGEVLAGIDPQRLATLPAWARAALELMARNSRAAITNAAGGA